MKPISVSNPIRKHQPVNCVVFHESPWEWYLIFHLNTLGCLVTWSLSNCGYRSVRCCSASWTQHTQQRNKQVDVTFIPVIISLRRCWSILLSTNSMAQFLFPVRQCPVSIQYLLSCHYIWSFRIIPIARCELWTFQDRTKIYHEGNLNFTNQSIWSRKIMSNIQNERFQHFERKQKIATSARLSPSS